MGQVAVRGDTGVTVHESIMHRSWILKPRNRHIETMGPLPVGLWLKTLQSFAKVPNMFQTTTLKTHKAKSQFTV